MYKLLPSIICFIFNSCQSPPSYGITNSYLEVTGNTPGAESCYKVPSCDSSSKYRTIDGSCNNLENPIWGSAETTYMRLMPAEYQDGLQEIRKAKDGNDLPNVRQISSTLFPDVYVPDKSNSLALMQWGQVLTHDSASTGFPVILDCCPNGQFANPPNPKCFPIKVPANDPFYSKYNVTCMTYTRIENTEVQKCKLKPQQQFSYATQWLDLSLLYGSDSETAKSIRELKGGRLKVEIVDGEVTLPVTHEKQDFCRITSSNQSCLNTGDVRVNQNPDLLVMTIVFMKEHNKIAEELAKLNPNWTDEQLYQEARRINIAQEQHITYSEYLPHVLDPHYIEGLKLASLNNGNTKYDSKIRGGTINEFTGAIFRTFHSTLQGDLKLIKGGKGRCPFKSALLGDYWWTSGDLVLQCFEELAKGLMAQDARIFKNYFTVQQTEFFQKGEKKYGDDLESVDIMRGRDAGFPSYNKYRKLCGLSTFSNFKQLTADMSHQAVDKLEKLYTDVDDIDLFVGALLETPVSPGLTGPLIQCVLSQQLARWKFSDRFYYEHNESPVSFTKDQLNEIRKVTFSSLMCRNTKVDRIQKKGFYQASSLNNVVPCSQIHSINLNYWKE